MGINTRHLMAVATLCVGACAGASAASRVSDAAPDPVAPDAEESLRTARWQELQHALFGGRSVQDGAAWLSIDAPARALDAALVPVTLGIKSDQAYPSARGVKGIYLIIDNNPGPLAGHFVFGPQSDPRSLKLRVRVNAYTYMHAVAETADNQLYAVARFVKAAGGCSAPAGGDDEASVHDIGHIKLRLLQPFAPGKALEAQLMVRHPNFNGMQMNQMTHLYTPAMFIRSIDVSYDGAAVLHLDSDISLSSDPVIVFGFVPPRKGELKVLVRDTRDSTFGQSFAVPAASEAAALPAAPAG